MCTKSERLFEELCEKRGVRFEVIDTDQESRTPDYRIWLNDVEVIVEVKQIEPGEFEQQLIDSTHGPDPSALISTVASRIRNKFDKAKYQIRNLAKGKHPGLFVIYDATQGLSLMDAQDILNVMYGDEIARIKNTQNTIITHNIDHRFGGNRKLDHEHNRSVSAFAWLLQKPTNNPSLLIYHNDYAEIRINPNYAKLIADSQYIRKPGGDHKFRGWETVDG